MFPEPSAVRVAAGVPLTRPQKTLTLSPGPKPVAETVTVAPGFPAALPSIVAWPIPPGVTSAALAWVPPGCWTITVALDPVIELGMVNPEETVPLTDVRPCATTFPGPRREERRNTTTELLRAKPLPTTPTWPPGATRPGFSAMTGPPPAEIRRPPSVTVGTGFGLDVGALAAGGALPAFFPWLWMNTWTSCQTITRTTMVPRIDFQLTFPFFTGGRSSGSFPPGWISIIAASVITTERDKLRLVSSPGRHARLRWNDNQAR